MSLLEQISTAVQQGKAKDVVALVQEALDRRLPPSRYWTKVCSGMSILGVKFKNNEVFVPEVLIGAGFKTAGPNCSSPVLSKKGWSRLAGWSSEL